MVDKQPNQTKQNQSKSNPNQSIYGGACGVMVAVVGNGIGNSNSDLGLDCFHFTKQKDMNPTILFAFTGK